MRERCFHIVYILHLFCTDAGLPFLEVRREHRQRPMLTVLGLVVRLVGNVLVLRPRDPPDFGSDDFSRVCLPPGLRIFISLL